MKTSFYDPIRLLIAVLIPIVVALLLVGCGLWVLNLSQPTIEAVQATATTAAVIIGGLYFLFRAASGEFWSGLQLSVKTRRVSQTPLGFDDWLLVEVSITNNKALSITLLDARAIVRDLADGGVDAQVLRLGSEFWRHPIDGDALALSPSSSTTAVMHTLAINQGDALVLVGSQSLPSTSTVAVDVVLLGRSKVGVARMQWVSSTFSVPNESSAVESGRERAQIKAPGPNSRVQPT